MQRRVSGVVSLCRLCGYLCVHIKFIVHDDKRDFTKINDVMSPGRSSAWHENSAQCEAEVRSCCAIVGLELTSAQTVEHTVRAQAVRQTVSTQNECACVYELVEKQNVVQCC